MTYIILNTVKNDSWSNYSKKQLKSDVSLMTKYLTQDKYKLLHNSVICFTNPH